MKRTFGRLPGWRSRQSAGFTVKICASGVEALKEAPQWMPDLILLDVMMPDMDGPSTLAELRAIPELASIPVVFMTAKVQPQEVESYKALGALDVVAKPFDPMRLADTINTIWARGNTGA